MKYITHWLARSVQAGVTLLRSFVTMLIRMVRRAEFLFPRDSVERLEVQRSLYKTLNLALLLAVLGCGVWLEMRGISGWLALSLLALRLLYALPAKRVERTLRTRAVTRR